MEKITKRITDYSTWAASSDLTAINLLREGLITEVRIRAAITTAALTKTMTLENYKRALANIKIEGDGGRAYLGVSAGAADQGGGRLLGRLNELDFGCPFLTPPVNIGATVGYYSWVFHPGSNPKDPFDMSAVIPARALSTLQAKITTTANTCVDANAAVASGYYYYEINEVLDVAVPEGIMVPLSSTLTKTPGAVTYSDFSLEVDVPAGAWLRRIVIFATDDTATNSLGADDEVTAVKLFLPKAARAQIEANWEDLKVATAKRYGYPGQMNPVVVTTTEQYPAGMVGPVIPKGFVVLDLRDYFHPVWGANLTDYQTGDVKLGLTSATAANEDIMIFWDQLQPVDRVYVGK